MNDEPKRNDEAQAGQTLARPACSASGYRSVTLLASEHSNLAEYLGQLERDRDDMLAFIREQVALWDNDGDSGFPLYKHGKRILARYSPPNNGLTQ